MKSVLKYAFLFVILSFAFSSFTGCGSDSAGTDKVIADKNDTGSGYPKAPAAIANAEVELIDGGSFKLGDAGGKVILINLWATWCGPCRNEMPELVKMQEMYGSRGFEVIGLDVGPEPLDLIRPFAEKMKLNYKLGWASEELVGGFFDISQRNGIPQSFLFNREGELTGVYFGGGPGVIEKMKENVAILMKEQ